MIRNKLLAGMLALAVAISLLTPALAAPVPFTDVPTSAWYYQDVQTAYNSGLINGRSGTSFAPNGNLTYAEAVKLATCMNQKYTKGSVTLASGTDRWYSTYVDYAKANQIISRDYSWNANATRAGYVEIFAHALPDTALAAKNTVADNAIPDVKSSHPQAAEIYKLYRAGILAGNDAKGTFLPDSNIKRSEVAAILTRMMDQKSRLTLSWAAVSKTVLDKAEASKVKDSITQALYYAGATTFPNVTPNLNNAAEQYLLNGADPKVTMSGKAQGEINSFSFNSYTDAERFVNNLKSSNSFILQVSGGRVEYDSYGVAVANTPSGVKVCIVTEGGTSQQPTTPVNPSPVNPTPTPVNPDPVTPTPTPTTTSNTDIEKQLYEYLCLVLPSYGVTSVPTRNTQLDTAAKLVAEGKYTNVDDALKAAGFNKPYMDTTSPSDPNTTLSYAHWSEKFDNLSYSDIVTLVSDLVKRDSKCMTASYSGSVAKLGYDEIGICVMGDDSSITVSFVMYNSNPTSRTLNLQERAQMFIEEQLATPLNASSEQLEMLEMVNAERAKIGASELKMLPIMNEIAEARAKEYMIAREQYGPHKRPDGTSYKTIFNDYGLGDFVAFGVGENASWACGSVQGHMEGLMSSTGHRAQILKENHKYIGLGKHIMPEGYEVWIQLYIDW